MTPKKQLKRHTIMAMSNAMPDMINNALCRHCEHEIHPYIIDAVWHGLAVQISDEIVELVRKSIEEGNYE